MAHGLPISIWIDDAQDSVELFEGQGGFFLLDFHGSRDDHGRSGAIRKAKFDVGLDLDKKERERERERGVVG